jgi:large subunit ribosomal protein L1
MNKRSKRFKGFKEQIDPDKTYPAEEAIELVKKTSQLKFDAGVEVHIRLGVDSKKADQVVRGSVTLPHGTGKKKKMAVFCEGKDQDVAKKAGAELIGGEELIADIKKTGKCNFEIALATPAIMKKMGQIAKILGPKGLMPNPRNETVVKDIAKSVKELSEGKVTFRNDDSGNIHQLIGRVSFELKQLVENYKTFFEAVRSAKPSGVKGTYIKNISLCSTMGPGIKVNL